MRVYVLQGQIEDDEDEIWEVLYAGIEEKDWESYLKENITALILEVWEDGEKIHSEIIES